MFCLRLTFPLSFSLRARIRMHIILVGHLRFLLIWVEIIVLLFVLLARIVCIVTRYCIISCLLLVIILIGPPPIALETGSIRGSGLRLI